MKTYIQEILLTFGSILLVHNVCAEIDSGNFDVYLKMMWPQKVGRIIKSIWLDFESEFDILPDSFLI